MSLSRWIGRLVVVGALVATSLAASACGESEPTILDTEKVERAIERSSLVQRKAHAQVSCPSGVHQKKGAVFSCTAIVKRKRTRFVVTQLDNAGHVRYEGR